MSIEEHGYVYNIASMIIFVDLKATVPYYYVVPMTPDSFSC